MNSPGSAAAPRARLRKVYILPNLFTALNLFLGMAAIFIIQEGRLAEACGLIILAGLMDGLDGAVARLTHTQSDFGQEFDSLSDVVSFGVAPSLAAFHLMNDFGVEHHRLILGVCALFAVCGALRLARYNVQARGSERKGFLGLPIPGAALAVVFYILLTREYDLHLSERVLLPLGDDGVQLGPLVAGLLPFVVLALSLLMVSEVPYPKIVRKIRLRRHMSFDSLVSIVLLAVLLVALQSDLRILAGFLLIYGYLLFGLGAYAWGRLRKPGPAAPLPAVPPPTARPPAPGVSK